MLLHIPHASRLLHIPSMLPSVADACFWLVVGFKVVDRWSSKAVVYFILFYFILFFVTQFDTPNNGMVSPHALPPTCLCSNTPPTTSAN
jgi:hypothetical protein